MTEFSNNHHSGKFITFEGIDGAGKSTHIAFVTEYLQARGIDLVSSREPGGTQLGEKLRELVLHETMHLETEALLMFASRREHLAQVISPALARGAWVISDRFTDASFAYQGGGRGMDLAKLEALEQWVHPHLQPDLTLLFDVPLDVARARLDATRSLDKFEQEKADFFGATRNEYLRRATQFPQRFRIIDSTRTIAAIEVEIAAILDKLLTP
jgi:dTMP kinase